MQRTRVVRLGERARRSSAVPSVLRVVDDEDLVVDAGSRRARSTSAVDVRAIDPASSWAGMTTESFTTPSDDPPLDVLVVDLARMPSMSIVELPGRVVGAGTGRGR